MTVGLSFALNMSGGTCSFDLPVPTVISGSMAQAYGSGSSYDQEVMCKVSALSATLLRVWCRSWTLPDPANASMNFVIMIRK